MKNELNTFQTTDLTLHPIGFLYSNNRLKFDVKHQPTNKNIIQNYIELLPHQNFEHALQDINGFSRIWIIWWFHLNTTWRPKVLPPRGEAKRRGVFSTRSPHRPNPIGISNVALINVQGRILNLGDTDLVNGTPILDIKPYIPEIDSYPDEKTGWLSDIDHASDLDQRNYQIIIDNIALTQLDWLKSKNINIFDRASEILTKNPYPHRTRRITKISDDEFRIGCGAWRIFYSINSEEYLIKINRIRPGYPDKSLNSSEHGRVPYREEQIEFNLRFGYSG